MSDSKFLFSYSLHEHGWATACLNHGKRIEMAVSYLHDTVLDLATSALLLDRGTDEAKVIFMDEPGEHQLILTACGADNLSYELRWYEDWESWGIVQADQYRLVAEGRVTLKRYKHQVANLLHALHGEYGPDEYRKRWMQHPFPLKQYRKIMGQAGG